MTQTSVPYDKTLFFKKIFTFLKYLILLAIVIGFIELGIFLKTKYNELPIEKIKVVATYEHIQPKVLQNIITPSVTNNFFGLDLVGLKNRILLQPWVKHVTVKRAWPNTIEITIYEQKAVGNWENEALLNDEGELFRPPKESFPDGLPLFSAPPEYVKAALQEYQKLQDIISPLSWKIVGINLDELLSWRIILNNGSNIFLGNEDIEERLEEFVKSYSKVKTKTNNHDKIESIDLRYQNGFAIKWD